MADKLLLMTAHHKEDPFIPISQKLFFPIQVGKELSEIDLKINSDNQGDSISNKNKTFCELTAYYYAWKNRDEEYIGLMHYRRIFSSRKYLLHNFTAKIKYLIIVGEDEVKAGKVTLKDMITGEQKLVKFEDIITNIKK